MVGSIHILIWIPYIRQYLKILSFSLTHPKRRGGAMQCKVQKTHVDYILNAHIVLLLFKLPTYVQYADITWMTNPSSVLNISS